MKKVATSNRQCLGYARVSSAKQAEHGVSLEAQQEKIRAMAVVQGIEISEMIVDGGESAKSLDRPGMQKLLKLVDAGKVGKVIIAKLDRLTRSVRDLADLLERFDKRQVALVSVNESLDTGSAAGRLVINVMAAVSQWEREAIGERTRDALRHKKAKREVYANPPYGFCRVGHVMIDVKDESGKVIRQKPKGGRLEVNHAEMSIVRRIIDLAARNYSLRWIADVLNDEGFRTQSGQLWLHASVARVLRSRDLYEQVPPVQSAEQVAQVC